MLIALLAGSVAIAAAITIAPGQSITLQPGSEATTISCTAAPPASAPPSSESFCFCRATSVENSTDFSLSKVVIQGTLRSETELKSYSRQKDCDAAIKSYPACK